MLYELCPHIEPQKKKKKTKISLHIPNATGFVNILSVLIKKKEYHSITLRMLKKIMNAPVPYCLFHPGVKAPLFLSHKDISSQNHTATPQGKPLELITCRQLLGCKKLSPHLLSGVALSGWLDQGRGKACNDSSDNACIMAHIVVKTHLGAKFANCPHPNSTLQICQQLVLVTRQKTWQLSHTIILHLHTSALFRIALRQAPLILFNQSMFV